MSDSLEIQGYIIDIQNSTIFPGAVLVEKGIIKSIQKMTNVPSRYILPGLVDSHIHIESSMLTPYEFARKALIHGTVATVSDPHEIANVCGMEGIYYMLKNAADAKLKINFGAPSCVPATTFETAGATITPENIQELLARDDVRYLTEMMNYPGVLFNDPVVMEKIRIAKSFNKPVDGHAPGLMGDDAIKYIEAGITTDHECFTKEEALHKLKHGMKILIREGSAARNFEALHELISEYPHMTMLCSDDKHPDELITGHLNVIVKRALAKGHNLFDVLRVACINPVKHYNLPVGLLQPNDPADFIVIDNPENFNILETYINGEKVAENGHCMLPPKTHEVINNFSCDSLTAEDFNYPINSDTIPIIEAIDGQLITNKIMAPAKIKNGFAVADVDNDLLKLVVVNRYNASKPAVSFIKNFKIKNGALASTVAHDSHNIIAVGTDDESIAKAVNLLIQNRGGLSAVDQNGAMVLPLPIAGLMSPLSCDEIGESYSAIDKKVKSMGCNLRAPFMTLSFMALLVIPKLKLSDKGLFDGEKFEFVNLNK
ncbi:MAG: adenine deaminase [Bacteroidetes bacterium]|nr:adenine deaminase [Bacteroidota bacterium]MBK9424253.1 adenine deaminase [Bacteroidota bacterium]